MATFKTFVLTVAIDGDVNTDTLAYELERIIEYARQHHSLSSASDDGYVEWVSVKPALNV